MTLHLPMMTVLLEARSYQTALMMADDISIYRDDILPRKRSNAHSYLDR
jgi:hypothetical protein